LQELVVVGQGNASSDSELPNPWQKSLPTIPKPTMLKTERPNVNQRHADSGHYGLSFQGRYFMLQGDFDSVLPISDLARGELLHYPQEFSLDRVSLAGSDPNLSFKSKIFVEHTFHAII
jgi:hypothetical protein